MTLGQIGSIMTIVIEETDDNSPIILANVIDTNYCFVQAY